MEAVITKFLALSVALALLLSVLWNPGTQSCAAIAANPNLVGGECTAEIIQAQTLWQNSFEIAAMISKELLLLLVVVLGLKIFAHHIPKKIKVSFRLRLQAALYKCSRWGPIPRGIFVPYLFATHGG